MTSLGCSGCNLAGRATDKAAPIRAIVDHRTHLSALDVVLPEGNIHLTLSSLRKFAAQRTALIPSWSTAPCSSPAS